MHWQWLWKTQIYTDLKLAACQGDKEDESKGWLKEDGFQPIRIQQCVYEKVRCRAEEKMNMLFRCLNAMPIVYNKHDKLFVGSLCEEQKYLLFTSDDLECYVDC